MSSMSEDTLPTRCCANATPFSPDEIRNPVVANGFMVFCGTPGTEGTGKKSRKRWKILQCPYDAACFLNEPGNVFFTLDPQSALRKEPHSFDATSQTTFSSRLARGPTPLLLHRGVVLL